MAALQLAVIYLPWLQSIFSTSPLAAVDLVVTIGVGVIVFTAIEIEKKLRRKQG